MSLCLETQVNISYNVSKTPTLKGRKVVDKRGLDFTLEGFDIEDWERFLDLYDKMKPRQDNDTAVVDFNHPEFQSSKKDFYRMVFTDGEERAYFNLFVALGIYKLGLQKVAHVRNPVVGDLVLHTYESTEDCSVVVNHFVEWESDDSVSIIEAFSQYEGEIERSWCGTIETIPLGDEILEFFASKQ